MNIFPPFTWTERFTRVGALILLTVALFVCLPVTAHADEVQATPTPMVAPRASAPIDSFPPPSLASLLQTLPALNPQLEALREATFLLGEGDRLNQTGQVAEARKKWLAAIKAYEKAESGVEVMQVSIQLAESSMWEAYRTFDPEKARVSIDYALQGMRVGAEIYEKLIQQYRTFDQAVLKQAKTHYNEAADQCQAGHYQAGLVLLEEAQRLYHSVDFAVGELRVVAQKGECQLDSGDMLGSLFSMMEALDISLKLPNGDATSALSFQAKEQYAQGDLQGALVTFQEVLKRRQTENNQAGVGGALLGLGDVYEAMGNYPEAEKFYQKALPIYIALEDDYSDHNEAVTRYNLANIAVVTGRYTEAIASYVQAIQIWKRIGRPFEEAVGLNALAVALQGYGQDSEASATIERANAIYQKLTPDPIFEAYLFNNRGSLNFSRGNYQEADRLFRSARALLQNAPTQRYQAMQVQVNIAGVSSTLGRFEEALVLYQQVLDFANQKKLEAMTAQVRFNIASVQIQQGDYQTAIATFLQILPIFQQYEMALDQARTIHNIGAAYMKIGNLAEAEAYLQQALTQFQDLHAMEYIAFVQNNLGALAFLARRWDQSTADYNAALATWRTQKNLVGVSRALNNLSLVAAAQHDFHTAQQRGEEALAASQQAKAQVEQVKILFSLGGIYLALGLDEQAYQSAQAALELADQLGDPLTATGGHIILAVAYLKQGELPAAYAQIQIAINLLETLQGSLTVPELKSTFLSQAADVYAIAALLAFQMEEPEQAFYYTEQGRARTFLDQIGNRRISKSGDHAALLQQELALRQRISQLQTALREPQNQSAAQVDATPTPLREELEAARAEYTRLLTDLKIVEPEYASLISVAALTLQEVQAQVLDEQTTLIIYYTFNDLLSDQTFAWVIDRQHAQLIPLNISRKALNNEITNMDNLISLKTFEPQASAQLYQAIFAPLKPYIHHPNLIIVPHQSIHYLPFAALWDAETQHYLLQDYAITYGPSASALRFILEKRNPNQGRLLALGNPNGSLPNAEAEVGSVAQLYNVKPLVRAQATESQVYNQAGKIDILHLAAHGVYDQLNPLFTRIELVPDDRNDGHLEVHEILNLNLAGTNLVVLSACETALGEQNNGDEIVSLTRAFLYAGTSSVVSTLWQVDDVASAKLMTAFYRYLRTGMTTAEALQAAQLEILRDESWQSPYYWAAFSLHGDYLGHDE